MSNTLTDTLSAFADMKTSLSPNTSNPETSPSDGAKESKLPTLYYFLVLFSPLLLGLSFVVLGLLFILSGVLLILCFPFFLIVGPFIIPRRVSPDHPRWGWKAQVDKRTDQLRTFVKRKLTEAGIDGAKKAE